MWGVLLVATVATVALSPRLGAAEPTFNYRPALPEDALVNGCWPLPGGARFEFGYQVRRDTVELTTAGTRRVLVLHYDRVDPGVARALVDAALTRAGVPERRFRVWVHPFEQLDADALVRGEMVLWLPPTQPRGASPECTNPFATKNFIGVEGRA